ncbi:MAG: O-antigen ligase family protein [Agriterribacter sp.]
MFGKYKIDRFLAAWIAIPLFFHHAHYFFPDSIKPILSPFIMIYVSIFLFAVLVFIPNPRLSFVKELQILLLFFLILVIGLTYTNAIGYGSSKIAILYLWIFVYYIYGFIIVNNFDVFIKISFFTGAVFLFLLYQKFGDPISFFQSMQGEIVRLGVTEDSSGKYIFALNPIWVARYLGLLFLLALSVVHKGKRNYIIYAYMVCLFLYMITSGSKGPIIALLGGCAIFLADNKLANNMKYIFTFLVLVAGLLLLLDFIDFFSSSFFIARFSGESSSGTEREELIDMALRYRGIPGFLFGNGTGDFGYLMNRTDKRLYPHNIFAELYYENGIVGVSIIIIMMYTVFKKFAIIFRHRTLKLICAIFVYYALNTMFSGDLGANQFFFIFFILLHFEIKLVEKEEMLQTLSLQE